MQVEPRDHFLADVSFTYYQAGHMMYVEKASREKLHKDIAAFVQSASAAASGK